MKKILPILLLSAAAAFLLSSCDQILEAFYPIETGTSQTVQANNTITFNVKGTDQATWDAFNTYWQYGGFWQYMSGTQGPYKPVLGGPDSVKIYVEVDDQNGTAIEAAHQIYFTGSSGYPPSYRLATTTFSSVKDGTYTFKVWFDVDNDGTPSLESAYYNGYYYSQFGTVDGTSSQGSIFLNGGSAGQSTTAEVSLLEYSFTQ